MEAECELEGWKGYEDAANKSVDMIERRIKPLWHVLKPIGLGGWLLGELFRWATLVSKEVPIAIVPLSTNRSQVVCCLKKLIAAPNSRSAWMQKLLQWYLRSIDKLGITGFQANWATNQVIYRLLDGGFVAFCDEARFYPQHVESIIESLDKHWKLEAGLRSFEELRFWTTLESACITARGRAYLANPDYWIRVGRSNRREKWARAMEELEIAPVRKWLALKFPYCDWTRWTPGWMYGYDEVRHTLDKVTPYCERKSYRKELEEAWKQRGRVNDERLELWRDWWQRNVVAEC